MGVKISLLFLQRLTKCNKIFMEFVYGYLNESCLFISQQERQIILCDILIQLNILPTINVHNSNFSDLDRPFKVTQGQI